MTNMQNTTPSEKLLQLFQAKEYKSVIIECEKLLKEESNIHYLNLVATSQRELGNLVKAEAAYIHALKLSPGDPNTLNNYAKLLIMQNQNDKAIFVYKSILASHPSNKLAQQNLDRLESLCMQEKEKKELLKKESQINRFDDPLNAAFNSDEVSLAHETKAKRLKLRKQKKAKQIPSLPEIDKNILADEYLQLARDAKNSGHNDLSLRFCTEASSFGGNLHSIYKQAAETYLSLKNYNQAHLCYLIARDYGELEPTDKVNLVSLAATLGDTQLMHLRNESLREILNAGSYLIEKSDAIMGNQKECHVAFQSKHGPLPNTSLSNK